MKRLITYFLQGLLYIAPFAITVYVIYFLFNFVDGLLSSYVEKYFDIDIPGLGALIIIVLLTFLGFIGQTILAQPFRILFSKIMQKAPIVRLIYTSLNDLFSAFVGKEKKFDKPVLVTINVQSDIQKLGFITQEDLEFIGQKDKVAVYFPHSYNFSGELFIVPKDQVTPVDSHSAEIMKFIVSGGITKINSNLGTTKLEK